MGRNAVLRKNGGAGATAAAAATGVCADVPQKNGLAQLTTNVSAAIQWQFRLPRESIVHRLIVDVFYFEDLLASIAPLFCTVFVRSRSSLEQGCSPIALETFIVVMLMLCRNERILGWNERVPSGHCCVSQNSKEAECVVDACVESLFGCPDGGAAARGCGGGPVAPLPPSLPGNARYCAFYSKAAFATEQVLWALLIGACQDIVWMHVFVTLGLIALLLPTVDLTISKVGLIFSAVFPIIWKHGYRNHTYDMSILTLYGQTLWSYRLYSLFSASMFVTLILAKYNVATSLRARAVLGVFYVVEGITRVISNASHSVPRCLAWLPEAVVTTCGIFDYHLVAGVVLWVSNLMLERGMPMSPVEVGFIVLGWTMLYGRLPFSEHSSRTHRWPFVLFYVSMAVVLGIIVPPSSMFLVSASVHAATAVMLVLSGQRCVVARTIGAYFALWICLLWMELLWKKESFFADQTASVEANRVSLTLCPIPSESLGHYIWFKHEVLGSLPDILAPLLCYNTSVLGTMFLSVNAAVLLFVEYEPPDTAARRSGAGATVRGHHASCAVEAAPVTPSGRAVEPLPATVTVSSGARKPTSVVERQSAKGSRVLGRNRPAGKAPASVSAGDSGKRQSQPLDGRSHGSNSDVLGKEKGATAVASEEESPDGISGHAQAYEHSMEFHSDSGGEEEEQEVEAHGEYAAEEESVAASGETVAQREKAASFCDGDGDGTVRPASSEAEPLSGTQEQPSATESNAETPNDSVAISGPDKGDTVVMDASVITRHQGKDAVEGEATTTSQATSSSPVQTMTPPETADTTRNDSVTVVLESSGEFFCTSGGTLEGSGERKKKGARKSQVLPDVSNHNEQHRQQQQRLDTQRRWELEHKEEAERQKLLQREKEHWERVEQVYRQERNRRRQQELHRQQKEAKREQQRLLKAKEEAAAAAAESCRKAKEQAKEKYAAATKPGTCGAKASARAAASVGHESDLGVSYALPKPRGTTITSAVAAARSTKTANNAAAAVPGKTKNSTQKAMTAETSTHQTGKGKANDHKVEAVAAASVKRAPLQHKTSETKAPEVADGKGATAAGPAGHSVSHSSIPLPRSAGSTLGGGEARSSHPNQLGGCAATAAPAATTRVANVFEGRKLKSLEELAAALAAPSTSPASSITSPAAHTKQIEQSKGDCTPLSTVQAALPPPSFTSGLPLPPPPPSQTSEWEVKEGVHHLVVLDDQDTADDDSDAQIDVIKLLSELRSSADEESERPGEHYTAYYPGLPSTVSNQLYTQQAQQHQHPPASLPHQGVHGRSSLLSGSATTNSGSWDGYGTAYKQDQRLSSPGMRVATGTDTLSSMALAQFSTGPDAEKGGSPPTATMSNSAPNSPATGPHVNCVVSVDESQRRHASNTTPFANTSNSSIGAHHLTPQRMPPDGYPTVGVQYAPVEHSTRPRNMLYQAANIPPTVPPQMHSVPIPAYGSVPQMYYTTASAPATGQSAAPIVLMAVPQPPQSQFPVGPVMYQTVYVPSIPAQHPTAHVIYQRDPQLYPPPSPR